MFENVKGALIYFALKCKQLLCLSFLLGSEKYVEDHVIMDDRVEFMMSLMRIVWGVNIAFAFVGCIFLKCDVYHVCCAVWVSAQLISIKTYNFISTITSSCFINPTD